MKDHQRSFSVVGAKKVNGCNTSHHEGRYLSTTPRGAADKAFTQHCRMKKIKGRCTLFMTMRETTRGSKGKEYTYKLTRELLEEPVQLKGYQIRYRVVGKSVDGVHKSCRK